MSVAGYCLEGVRDPVSSMSRGLAGDLKKAADEKAAAASKKAHAEKGAAESKKRVESRGSQKLRFC